MLLKLIHLDRFKNVIFAPWLILSIIFGGIGCASSPLLEPDLVLNDNNINNYIIAQKRKLKENERDAIIHYNLARAYFKKGWLMEAEKFARQANQFDPLKASYYELLGDIAYQQKQYREALNAFKTTILIDENLLSGYLKLSLTYEKIGETEQAIASIEEALQKDRRYVEALFHLARLSLQKYEYDNALQAINTVLTLEHGNQEALVLQVRIYTEKGNYYHASTLAKQLIALNPKSYQPYHEILRIFSIQKKWTEALDWIKKMDSLGLLQTKDLLIKSQIFFHKTETKKANTLLRRILKDDGLNVEAIMQVASLHLQTGELDKALKWLNRALEINNRVAKAYFLKAAIHFRHGNYLEGDLSMKRALELDAFDLSFQLLSLRRQMMKGETANVMENLDKLLVKHPTEPEVLRLQADLMVLQGKYVEAEQLLRQILVIDDGDLAWFSLARVLYFRGIFRFILPITQRLLKKHPLNWELTYLHSLTLSRLGDVEKAMALSKPFLTKIEGQGFIHRLVGDMLRYQGKEDEAQKIYREGLLLFPEHPQLLEALSASLIHQEKWVQARDILLKAIEKENPNSNLIIFLDRLVLVFKQLQDNHRMVKFLRLYHQKNDPLARAQSLDLERRFLFPIASPSLNFDKISAPTATQ